MTQKDQFLSLFDYLGHAAGQELGKAVFSKAQEKNQPIQYRHVSNKKYTGKITLYTQEFLDVYFKPEIILNYISSSSDDELPF